MSIFVNYSVGLSLVNHEKIKLSSKSILIFGILFNVGLLGYFKYIDFLIENFNGIFGSNVQAKWERTSMRNWSEIYPQLCIFFSEIMGKYTK